MSDYIKAWQCIGCGKIDSPQPCIGICQDRKVEFVYASQYEDALAQRDALQVRSSALERLVRRLARTKPHANEWERSYRQFQDEARALLASLSTTPAHEPPAPPRPTAILD